MFLEKAIDEIGKKNKVVIGFDLGNTCTDHVADHALIT